MGELFHDDVDSALQALEEERRKLADFDHKVAEARTTVKAKDKSVSATFDDRGELTALTFMGNKYRSMPPAELAHSIVETIRSGRAESMRKMNEFMGGSILPGIDFADLAAGRTSVSDVMESLMSPFLPDEPGTHRPGADRG